jgi:repressor LexA
MRSLAAYIAPTDCLEPCDVCDIPLLGRVAAGMPYAAFPVEDMLTVPKGMWAGKKVFALKVQGNSMIDEGIHNGDHIIVESRESAENGQTVVAEVDGGVTVKRFYREADGSIRLQPANPEMLPLIVRTQELRIIGVVVGVLRRLGFSERNRESRNAADTAGRPQPAARRSAPPSATDPESLELALNALDRQVEQWYAAIERAKRDRKLMKQVPSMAELGRDLEALRDWCARTSRPSLRRALLQEANRVMRRMQRFKSLVPVELADLECG